MILVAGGTGRLGTRIVNRLTERGREVRVLTRDPARAEHLPAGVDIVAGDVRDPTGLAEAVKGCTTVVSAIHGFVGPRGVSPATVDRDGNINLIHAADVEGAELVLMSIVGAAPDSGMELFRMKHAAEQHAAASGVSTTIVRATAFTELWIELLRQTAGRSGRPLVFGRGDNPINFVSIVDVAALVDHVIDDSSTRGMTIEIGGPDNVTFNDLARAVQAADGRTRPPRHVPPPVLQVVSRTIGRVQPQVRRQTRAAIEMDRIDLTFDAGPTHQRFPHLPTTPLADVLAASTPTANTP